MLDKFFKTIKKITPAKFHWILNHDGFKRYFANTGWMFFGQMFSLLVSFFVGAWIARYLGPENYGILNYAVAFVGLFGFIASLGVDGILNRELIKNPEERDKLLGTAFVLKLFGGSFAILLVVLSIFIFETNPLIRLLVILFSTSLVLQAVNVIYYYFQAETKSKKNVKALFLATLISSLLKITVIVAGKGIIWIMIIFIFDMLCQEIGFIFNYKKCGLKIKNWLFDKKLAITFLKNSWPLMLSLVASSIYLKIDQVIVGSLLGNRDVGIYVAATKLVEIWYFVPGIICASLLPAILNAKKVSLDLYKKRLKRFYILMAIIPILMAIPITIFAKQIIYILFGINYLESIIILKIYIWSSFGLFLSLAITQYLMSENLVKTIFWLNFLVMILNIILNFVFIPIFNLPGAALATLVSYLFFSIIYFVGGNIWKKIG